MHKKFLTVGILLLGVLAACNSGADTAVPTPTAVPATEVAAATHTPQATATSTPTQVPTATHTPTPAPTDTPTHTPTPEPTATKQPSPTPTIRASATPGAKVKPAPTGDATATGPEDNTETSEVTPVDPALDAMTILAKSQEAQSKVQTLTQHQVTLLVSGGVTQTQTHDCQRELPANAYCIIVIQVELAEMPEPMTSTLEMLVVDGAYWARETDEDAWEQLPDDLLQQMGLSDQLQFEFSVDPAYVTAAEITGQRVLDGIPVYEIQAELDAEQYFAQYFNEEMAAQILANTDDVSFTTTLWLSQEDFITRKQEVLMTLTTVDGETIFSSVQVTNSHINEPVSIPDPTANN